MRKFVAVSIILSAALAAAASPAFARHAASAAVQQEQQAPSGLQALCPAARRATPIHQAALAKVLRATKGRVTYEAFIAMTVVETNRQFVSKCDGKEIPMDDDGMDETPSPPSFRIAAR